MFRQLKIMTAHLLWCAVLCWIGAMQTAYSQPEEWQIITSMDDVGWNAIHFFDSQNGLIAATWHQPYCLMRTADGGYNWEGVIEFSTGFRPYKIRFYDRMRGYLVANFRAGLTYDGGETWEVLNLGHAIESPIYIDSLRMFAVSNEIVPPEHTIRRYYHSYDGGRTWEQNYEEIGTDGFGLPAYSESGTILMAAGPHTLWRSADLGENWQVIVDDTPIFVANRLTSPSEDIFIGAGVSLDRHPAIMRSMDDGLTWETVWTDTLWTTNSTFTNIEFIDLLHGWAICDSELVQTVNGGETWSSYFVRNTLLGLNDLTFVDTSLGWAVDGSFNHANIFRYGTPSEVSNDEIAFDASEKEELRVAPNPFNESTRITYLSPTSGNVSIELYNIQGRLTETLLQDRLGPGVHTIQWLPRNLPSGTYLCRVNLNGAPLSTQKIFMLK